MEISYIKDGNRNTMMIKEIELNENDYKLQMVMNNHIEGILPMSIEHINNQSIIKYNISSKIKLSDFYARKQMSGKEIYSFIKDIKMLSEKMQEYLLDINSIAFEVEMIYFNRQTGRYEFCYIPNLQGDFQVRLRDLFDKLLEYINHNDKEAVMIAYGIQQMTLGVDFTLQDILKCAFENMRKFQKEEGQKQVTAKSGEVCEQQWTKAEGGETKEEKRGILGTIQMLFRRKEKYKTTDEIELSEYFEEEKGLIVAEEVEAYNSKDEDLSMEREERTMLLTNQEIIKPIVLTATGTETPVEIKPLSFPYIIGKSTYSCDFCIDSAVISRVHMRILEELGDYLVEDLNSTNGTFINGEKLKSHEPHPITTGDRLTIANVDFLVE